MSNVKILKFQIFLLKIKIVYKINLTYISNDVDIVFKALNDKN